MLVNLEVNGQIPRVKGWRQRLTQAGDVSNGAARADMDDVNKRVERVGAREVSDGVEAFTIL